MKSLFHCGMKGFTFTKGISHPKQTGMVWGKEGWHGPPPTSCLPNHKWAQLSSELGHLFSTWIPCPIPSPALLTITQPFLSFTVSLSIPRPKWSSISPPDIHAVRPRDCGATDSTGCWLRASLDDAKEVWRHGCLEQALGDPQGLLSCPRNAWTTMAPKTGFWNDTTGPWSIDQEG